MKGAGVLRQYLGAAVVVCAVVGLTVAVTVLSMRTIALRNVAVRDLVDASLAHHHAFLALAEESAALRGELLSTRPEFLASYREARVRWREERGVLLGYRARVPRLAGFVAAADALQGYWDDEIARVRAGDRAGALRGFPLGHAAFEQLRRRHAAIDAGMEAATFAERAARDRAMQRIIAMMAAMGGVLLLAGATASSLALRERASALLARTDSLTKLPNRRGFDERLAQVLGRRRPRPRLAILYLDLDGFKEINDRHGHRAGDEVLVAFGERLRAVLRPHDTVARLGGDEFAAILDRLDDEDAHALASRVAEAMEEPLPTPSGDRRVSVSIGIARLPEDGSEVGALLAAADAAMYRVKRTRQTVGPSGPPRLAGSRPTS